MFLAVTLGVPEPAEPVIEREAALAFCTLAEVCSTCAFAVIALAILEKVGLPATT
jgi:hypothetical protein